MQLLILDDWLRDPLTPAQARDVADILDDRYDRQAAILASQLPMNEWHARLGEPTVADAVLDRLIHNAHHLELRGESQRKLRARNTATIATNWGAA